MTNETKIVHFTFYYNHDPKNPIHGYILPDSEQVFVDYERLVKPDDFAADLCDQLNIPYCQKDNRFCLDLDYIATDLEERLKDPKKMKIVVKLKNDIIEDYKKNKPESDNERQ